MTSSTAPPLLHVAPPLSRQASEAMDEDMVSDQFATDFLGALAVNEQSRYTMRYTSPVVESAYEASHWAHGRLRARNVLLGSALVYFAFAFSDIARFEDDYHVLLPLRYAAPRPCLASSRYCKPPSHPRPPCRPPGPFARDCLGTSWLWGSSVVSAIGCAAPHCPGSVEARC